jgi:hypothetical protein
VLRDHAEFAAEPKEGLDKSIQDLPAHAESGACPDLSLAKSIAYTIVSRDGRLEACGTSE